MESQWNQGFNTAVKVVKTLISGGCVKLKYTI